MSVPAIHMRWANLLFVHRRVEPRLVAPLLPTGLALDTFDGSAWIGPVPFRMENVHVHGFGAFAGPRSFFECNVRTCATAGDARSGRSRPRRTARGGFDRCRHRRLRPGACVGVGCARRSHRGADAARASTP